MRTALQIPEWFPVAEAPLPSPVDDYRIEAMVNGFIVGKQEALFTAPDAFYRLQAADAVQGRPAIAQRLMDLQTATLDQARDDAERAAPARCLDLHLDDAMDGIDRHVAGLRRVHQREVVAQRQALIQRAAELEHDNNDKIAGLAEANASVALELARLNDEPDGPSIQAARSAVWRTAIGQRLANGRNLQALTLFDRVKDQLESADLLSLDLPLQVARHEQAADQWIAREVATAGHLLQQRLDADDNLPPTVRYVIRAKVDARESANEGVRAVKIHALDDHVRDAAHSQAINPGVHKPNTFARLADEYDTAGEREKAAILRRMAVQDAFIMPFARASTDKQQQMTDELPEGELRDTAIAMQRDQVESFERDAFAAGTALYKEVGPPVPIDDVRGRIRQARQIAQRRGGISVAPFTLRELDDIQNILAEGLEQDKQTIRVYLAAVPADIRPPTEPKDVIAPTDPDGAATTGSTQTSQVDVPRLAALQSTDGVVDGNTSISEDDSRGPLTSDPVMTAQVVPPTIMFGRTPPSIGRPVPPPGTVPTPEGLTPFEQLPRGSSGGDRAGRPFPRKDNPYPEGTPCTYCGKPTTKRPGLPDTLEREHIIPRSRGGDGEPSNRAPSCRSCNREKSGRPPSEWYLWR